MTTRFNLIATLVALAAVAVPAFAAQFPISDLGNCRDQKECALFCAVPANKAACWTYAQYGPPAASVRGETTDTETAATPASIFPIAELGNCADVKACKAYCDETDHFTACLAAAKKHGLTRAATSGQMSALVAHAKEELGCTSQQQCRALCAEPANSEKCQALAEKYGSLKHRLAKETLLENAKTILGCQNLEECRVLCADAANAEKCQAFKKEHVPLHLLRKLQRVRANASGDASLPCTTLEECRTYCSDPAHATACTTSGEGGRLKLNVQRDNKYTCATDEECERYCQANPEACPRYKKSDDYKNFLLQEQRRNKAGEESPGPRAFNLERYQKSLIQSSPASSPAPAN